MVEHACIQRHQEKLLYEISGACEPEQIKGSTKTEKRYLPGGVGNVGDSAMVKDLLGSAGGKRNGTAHRQAETFRRRAFREIECIFG